MAETMAGALGRETVPWRDGAGVDHKLPPLTINDLIELEEEAGSLSEWATTGVRVRSWRTVLWLSVRKEGLTREEVRARKFKVTQEDVGEMMSFVPIVQIGEVTRRVLEVSGLVAVKRPLEDAEPPSSGAPSSDPPSPSAST